MKRRLLFNSVIAIAMLYAITACKKDDPIPVSTTITLVPTKDGAIYSTTIDATYDDRGNGGSELIQVGWNEWGAGFPHAARGLVAFDLSSIPAGAVIKDVELLLYVARKGANTLPVSVHKLTEDWNEGTASDGCTVINAWCSQAGTVVTTEGDATWSSTQFGTSTWTTAGGTFVALASATSFNDTYFNSQGLIDDVKAWIATPAENFGWILKVDETTVQRNGGELIRYGSRNAVINGADASQQPQLKIRYEK